MSTTVSLNRQDRRALRFAPTTPIGKTVAQLVASASDENAPASVTSRGEHQYPTFEGLTRAMRRRWQRDVTAGRAMGAPCCEIDYLPLAQQRRLMRNHDRDIERSGQPHGAACHFCS